MNARAARALLALTAAALPALLPGVAHAATPAFGAGDLVVYRVGSGTGSLVNTGSPVYLDEYTPAGALVQSIALPTTASGANKAVFASGTATSEGLLTLSADGRYLVLTGYSLASASGSVANTTGAADPRVVGRVDSTGTVDTSTALTDFATANNPRSAASADGSSFYLAGGAGGIRYAPYGATTSTQLTSATNWRDVVVANGQLYASSSSSPNVGVSAIGTGLPTSGTAAPALLEGTSTSAYQFAVVTAGSTTALYVADDSANAILKFIQSGSSWVASGSSAASGVRGLTAAASADGSKVEVYGTTGGSGAAGGGTIYHVTDSAPAGSLSTAATSIASASANEAFRGIAFAPTAAATAPPTALPELAVTPLLVVGGLAAAGGVVVVARRRRLA